MSDEYLWNRKGKPDKEVVRLEKMLGKLQYKAEKPRPKMFSWTWLAVAAVLLAGVTGGVIVWNRSGVTGWQLADGSTVRKGQLIETGASAHATLESQLTGRVEVDPKSRLRMVAAGSSEQRFQLEKGTIHALIWAPPGRFVVDTPSAKAVDLGCQYTLQVTGNGTGLVSVETGWVAFEWQNREAFIPAGAECITRPRLGPGTPWFSDAPSELKSAVSVFDQTQAASALETAVRASRNRDALTLWHLMVRTSGEQRGKVFERFAGLVKLPPGTTREAVLRGDPAALDASWNALDLGSTEWWREWKRKW